MEGEVAEGEALGTDVVAIEAAVDGPLVDEVVVVKVADEVVVGEMPYEAVVRVGEKGSSGCSDEEQGSSGRCDGG